MSLLLVSRTDVVDIVDSLQFDDTEDVFEREPFSVLVRHKETGRGKQCSVGCTTRWGCISDLLTEGRRPEGNKSLIH